MKENDQCLLSSNELAFNLPLEHILTYRGTNGVFFFVTSINECYISDLPEGERLWGKREQMSR